MHYMLAIGIATLFIFSIFIFRHLEKKQYNNGKCIQCGGRLKHFDYDSQGGRGYICTSCSHTVWVSYPKIDHKHPRMQ